MKTKSMKTMVLGLVMVAMLSLFAGAVSAQDDGLGAPTDADVQQNHPHGPRGDGPRGDNPRDNARQVVGGIIDELGLDAEEVRAQLEAGATLGEIITASGNSIDAVIDGVLANATERLTELVAEGTITQAQMDEHLANMETRLNEMMTRTFDGTNRPDRPNRGDGPRGAGQLMDIVAEATGLEASEIVEQVRNGEATLAEVIEANGGSVEAVTASALALVEAQVNERLEAGDITDEQATQFLERAEERITNLLNGIRPQRGNA